MSLKEKLCERAGCEREATIEVEAKLLDETGEVKDTIIRNLCQEHANELILAAIKAHEKKVGTDV